MSNKAKIGTFCIVNFIYGVLFSFILPIPLIFVLNLSDGICENPEGEMFVPISLMFLIFCMFLGTLLFLYEFKRSKGNNMYFNILILLSFLIPFVIGTVQVSSLWNELFEYIQWKW